uniref:Uncharacterized protein n=1 Tax=viral metagenome TaxID=1070528 RepID=A0A6C0CSM8_9ZZZZ
MVAESVESIGDGVLLLETTEGCLVPGSEVPGTDGEIFRILIIFRRYLSVGRRASK